MKTTARILTAFAFAAALAASAAPASAAVFQPNRVSYDLGKVNQDNGDDLAMFSIRPELVHGNVTAVVGINLLFDKEFRLRDGANDVVVLESLDLNRERLKVHYGDIEGLTLGRGFIVEHYYSNVQNNVQTNEDKGLVVDVNNAKSRITAAAAFNHLFAARAERSLGRVSLGATMALDSDPDLEAYGIDAKWKLVPDRWSAYYEIADIVHSGNGFVIGSAITPMPGTDLTFTGEYRKFDSDFAPGIVDAHYEAKPKLPGIRANTPGKVDGYYIAADYASGKNTSIKIFYEDYEATHTRGGLGVSFAPTKRVAFNLFYAQENLMPSAGLNPEDSVIFANLTLGIGKYMDLLCDYSRAFTDAAPSDQKSRDTYTTRIRFHKAK